MGLKKTDKKSAEEQPSPIEQKRYQEAKEFTRQMMEELLAPTDTSDKSGRAG